MDKSVLVPMLEGRVVVACVGNQLRGDDGVGPFVASLLISTDRVRVVDCGETPENYLGVISSHRPDRVLIVDAAHFGGDPGEIRTVSKAEITGGGISSHDAILTLFADYIEAGSGAKTFFLAIQPENTQVGTGLSRQVEAAGREIAAAINEIVRTSQGRGSHEQES
jgi:hydrogenase 3 maturation protease